MDELQKQVCEAIVNVFETGSAKGNYGATSYHPSDAGQLSYGRSQCCLAKGTLYSLLKRYVEAPGAEFAQQLAPYLNKVSNRDSSLNTDMTFRGLLKDAGQDPVMQREQDGYFDQNYFDPSVKAAKRVGLTLPLSIAVVYDSHIQGGWDTVAARVIHQVSVAGATCTEQTWIDRYIAARRAFLLSLHSQANQTTYRMDAFENLIQQNKWDLGLPLKVRGREITAALFSPVPTPPALPPVVRGSVPDPGIDDKPILHPAIPYPRGPAVTDLQAHLNSAGFRNSADGIYGPFTQVLTRQFQARVGLKADAVVGPMTWRELLQPSVGASL